MVWKEDLAELEGAFCVTKVEPSVSSRNPDSRQFPLGSEMGKKSGKCFLAIYEGKTVLTTLPLLLFVNKYFVIFFVLIGRWKKNKAFDINLILD